MLSPRSFMMPTLTESAGGAGEGVAIGAEGLRKGVSAFATESKEAQEYKRLQEMMASNKSFVKQARYESRVMKEKDPLAAEAMTYIPEPNWDTATPEDAKDYLVNVFNNMDKIKKDRASQQREQAKQQASAGLISGTIATPGISAEQRLSGGFSGLPPEQQQLVGKEEVQTAAMFAGPKQLDIDRMRAKQAEITARIRAGVHSKWAENQYRNIDMVQDDIANLINIGRQYEQNLTDPIKSATMTEMDKLNIKNNLAEIKTNISELEKLKRNNPLWQSIYPKSLGERGSTETTSTPTTTITKKRFILR